MHHKSRNLESTQGHFRNRTTGRFIVKDGRTENKTVRPAIGRCQLRRDERSGLCSPTGAHQPHRNVGPLLQPCDCGPDVGNVFRPLTEAPEVRWLLAVRWRIDHGYHQTIGCERSPLADKEILPTPLEASSRRDLKFSMASCEKHDRGLRLVGLEYDHTLGNTRAGWNVNDLLCLCP